MPAKWQRHLVTLWVTSAAAFALAEEEEAKVGFDRSHVEAKPSDYEEIQEGSLSQLEQVGSLSSLDQLQCRALQTDRWNYQFIFHFDIFACLRAHLPSPLSPPVLLKRALHTLHPP